MTVVVFLGPTLSVNDARARLDATFLPPAAQGDVYRAALRRPQAIGIIDGYFEHRASVWHKEVLWAMAQGIHVFGAASMGALRAAELADFGMEGVGEIYTAYRNGDIEDDDEVAVAHAGAADGYRALSEAMVNIRATIAKALDAGILHSETGHALITLAKSLFYADRMYSAILKLAVANGLPAGEIEAFQAWLPAGRVDQKCLDAIAMLELMSERLATSREPKRVRYRMENTDFWEQARRLAGESRDNGAGGVEPAPAEALIEELRLDPETYVRVRQAALLRHLAVSESRRAGLVVNPDALQATSDAFRRQRGLTDLVATKRWLEDHDLDLDHFARLIEDEYRLAWVDRISEADLTGRIADELRVTGEYARFRDRAVEKQRILSEQGLQAPGFADTGRSEAQVLAWYFRDCLGRPDIPDIESYALSLGFPGADAFRHAVLREYLYQQSAFSD